MNALETICWIHDELRQALDQVICEGVEMERIKVGHVGLLDRVGISVDGHRVFQLHMSSMVRTDRVDDRGLATYAEGAISHWDDRWRDLIKLLTIKRAIGEASVRMSSDELRERYVAGLAAAGAWMHGYDALEFTPQSRQSHTRLMAWVKPFPSAGDPPNRSTLRLRVD